MRSTVRAFGCGSVRRAPLTCFCASGNRVITATSTLLLLRGVADGSAAVASDAATGALRRAGVWPVVAWQPAPAAFTARCASRPLAASGARCVAVVANRSSAVGPLSAAADGAAKLLDSGAYLHWFQRFDVSRDALQDGLEATRAVVAEYRSAHGHDINA
jgi:rhodanese-related sulfurtransferase